MIGRPRTRIIRDRAEPMKFYVPHSYKIRAEKYGFRGRFLSQIVTALVDTLESKLSEEELRVYELAIQVGLLVPSKIVPKEARG